MEEVGNSGAAESQTSDQSQPTEILSNVVGDPVDIIVTNSNTGSSNTGGGAEGGGDMVKKKRGRPPRAQAKSPPVKMIKEEDEDVCFICFDGGSLVLCDRRGCPKAYHPACVKRDDAFFRSKAKWNCGWHICSVCQKAAHHMCYTCTYSLCKGCIKKTDYTCVRGDKGFCTVCMKTIMLIENGGEGKDEKAQVDFDDKTSWEYLFKVYWIYLKGKLSLTLDELTQAKKSGKEASATVLVIPSTCVQNGDNDQKNMSPDVPKNLEAVEFKRRKTDEPISMKPHKEAVTRKRPDTEERSSVNASKDWATKELLDFVAHMKNGDTSMLSQFDVQELMLEYIKRNNLRDPRKKSQILCDSRLKILFGKPRVGHFEMLKLLEFHFFINEDLPKNTIKSIAKQLDPDWNIDNMVTVGKEKKRRNHKKAEERAPQNELDEYAAIDVHNMNLIYLRRKLMENLIEDTESFQKKVVGSIVRIRITGSGQKHDMYRLVQVVGTKKADKPYKLGSKSADVVLEVLNLDKKETVSIATISNQDLSEDECRRLRQSIKCGLVKRFTVAEIQDKAVSIQPAKFNDLLEAETLRLNNLRDRASEKGHKKSLREYVEKLQLLKTPEERERRLREIPGVHSDPKMNPDYETDDAEEYSSKENGEQTETKNSRISQKHTSSIKKGKEFSKNVNSRSWKNDEGLTPTKLAGRIRMKKDANGPSSSGRPQSQVDNNGSTITDRSHNSVSETSTSSYSIKNTPTSNDSELDKVWHYRDPIGKVQGPFCMVQLQKWSTTGYFPQDMRIWTNQEDDSFLLDDVLKQQLDIKTSTVKVGSRIEGLTVRTTNLSPQKSVNYEKLSGTHGSTGLSAVQNWIANGATNMPSLGKSNESNMTELDSPTPAGNGAGTNKASSVFDIANADLMDLPSPTPKEKTTIHVDEKVQNAVDKEAGSVGGAQLPDTAKEWSGYSPTDRVVTTSVKMEKDIPSSSQPGYISLPTLQVVCEKVQNAVDKEVGNVGVAQLSETAKEWSGYSPTDRDKEAGNVGGVQLPETAKEWSGYSPTHRDVTTSAKMEQDIPSSSQPGNISLLTLQGVCEEVQNAVDKEVANVGATDCDVTTSAKLEQDIPSSTEPGYISLPILQVVCEKVPNAVDKEVGNVSGAQLPGTDKEWTGYTPTDRVVTTSSNLDQAIPSSSPPSSQPGYISLPTSQGVREMIEFSTLAEESVSDLWAEVDAMESQNGFPSPTSRRNIFVEDIFNGSFEDFSPTPIIQGSGTRSDPFSSNGAEIHFPFQPTTTATTTTTTTTTIAGTSQGNDHNVFDLVKSSTDLQFKLPEMPPETISKAVSDVNSSLKADERERKNIVETSDDRPGGSNEQNEGECTEPTITKLKDPSPELVLRSSDSKEESDSTVLPPMVDTLSTPPDPSQLVLQSSGSKEESGSTVLPPMVDTLGPPPPPPPPPPPQLPQSLPLAVGLAKVQPRQGNMSTFGRPAQEVMTHVAPHLNTSRGVTVGWDPHQQTYGAERLNINSQRERSYRVEDSGYSRNGKPWVRQSSFGSGSNGGGYSRAPAKGPRVCKFYENGRCRNGASCNYLHP